jgi:hypothetical protein
VDGVVVAGVVATVDGVMVTVVAVVAVVVVVVVVVVLGVVPRVATEALVDGSAATEPAVVSCARGALDVIRSSVVGANVLGGTFAVRISMPWMCGARAFLPRLRRMPLSPGTTST